MIIFCILFAVLKYGTLFLIFISGHNRIIRAFFFINILFNYEHLQIVQSLFLLLFVLLFVLFYIIHFAYTLRDKIIYSDILDGCIILVSIVTIMQSSYDKDHTYIILIQVYNYNNYTYIRLSFLIMCLYKLFRIL